MKARTQPHSLSTLLYSMCVCLNELWAFECIYYHVKVYLLFLCVCKPHCALFSVELFCSKILNSTQLTDTHTQTTSVRCKAVLVLPGPFLMFHLSSTHAHAHKSTRIIGDLTLESCKVFQRAIYDQSNTMNGLYKHTAELLLIQNHLHSGRWSTIIKLPKWKP